MQSSSGGVGGCRKGLLRHVEETTVGIETDFLHYVDLESHLEILVKPRTSGCLRSVVFSKYPGITCTWVEQELEEMTVIPPNLKQDGEFSRRSPSFPDFCALEHHEIGCIIGTSLLPSQAVLGRPMTARSWCGFPKCCWNRDLSKVSLLFSWMTWQSGFSEQWQRRG